MAGLFVCGGDDEDSVREHREGDPPVPGRPPPHLLFVKSGQALPLTARAPVCVAEAARASRDLEGAGHRGGVDRYGYGHVQGPSPR